MEEKKLLHERSSGQALVGLFVLVAGAFFLWLLFFQERDDRYYRLVAEFDAIDNLSEATQVKLRGFTVGQVESVQFRPQARAGEPYFLVTVKIGRDYPVPAGTVAEIRSSGLVGDTFIDLDVSQAEGPSLQAGSRLPGREGAGMKELSDRIGEMARKLGAAGESIRRADLGHRLGRLGDSLHRIAGRLDQVSQSADSLLWTSRAVLERTGPGVEATLAQLQESLRQMDRTMRRADTLVAGSRQDLHHSLKLLRQVVERLDGVLGRVDSLMARKEGQIDSTLDNLHAASESVRQISRHPWKLITGQGREEATAVK